MNSNAFLSRVNSVLGHGDRANKFRVKIPSPLFIGVGLKDLPSDFSYICKSTILPSREISTVDVWHKGRKLTIRDVTTFTGKWSATFYNDSEYKLRSFFEEWMFGIDRYTSVIARSLSPIITTYTTTIEIVKLNERQEEAIAYELFHAFPTSISDVQLNKENSAVTEFTVEFTYSYWEPKDVNMLRLI